MSLTLIGCSVYTEQSILPDAAVVIEDGFIQSVSNTMQPTNNIEKTLSFPSTYHLVPGFIDLHVHGANGNDVMDATHDALNNISKTLAAEGTTSFLATTMTANTNDIEKALACVHAFLNEKQTIEGAAILGIHLEGPFISPQKAGAQRTDQTRLPDIQLLEHWQKIAGNHIKLVTIAPELSNSVEFIRHLKQKKIIAALGHTNATYAETVTAIDEGLTYATHVFNAMRNIHQREPGATLAALLSQQVMTEVIVDGIHLHPAIVQLILTLKNKENMLLVTDAMRAKCLGDGTYDLGGQDVTVKENTATLSDGTLAGSTLKMPMAIQNIMRFTHCSLFDAIKMASENPAKTLGIFDKKGSIASGKEADLVVLDEHLQVVLTIRGGEIIYKKNEVLQQLSRA